MKLGGGVSFKTDNCLIGAGPLRLAVNDECHILQIVEVSVWQLAETREREVKIV